MIRGLGNMNNNSGGEGNQGPSFYQQAQDYIKSIPLITKIIAGATIVFYLLSWFSFLGSFVTFFQSVPYNTIFRFRLWTLATTIVITPSILNIIFAFMAWLPRAFMNEKELGSANFLLNVLSRTVIIQIMFTLLMFVFYVFAGDAALKVPSMGLWPLILADITISCTEEPDREVMFFFIPYPIKAKYYPWVLIGFFTLLNFNIQFDILCGVGFGYLFTYKLKDKLNISSQFVQKVENSFIFKYAKSSPSFISASQNSGFGFSGPQNVSTNNESKAKAETYEVRISI